MSFQGSDTDLEKGVYCWPTPQVYHHATPPLISMLPPTPSKLYFFTACLCVYVCVYVCVCGQRPKNSRWFLPISLLSMMCQNSS